MNADNMRRALRPEMEVGYSSKRPEPVGEKTRGGRILR
jgi:hypothetical protein